MILAIILAVVGAVSAWAINLLRLQVLYAASKQKGPGQGLRFRCWPVFAACGSAFQPPTVVLYFFTESNAKQHLLIAYENAELQVLR